MRVLLYDHGGHNFTYELASDLARRGLTVTYAFTASVTAPRGKMKGTPNLEIAPLGKGRTFERYRLRRRVTDELRLGLEAIALARRSGSRQVVTCNMPVIIVASIVGTLFALFQALTQIQEQTLSFAVKLIAVALVLFLTASWMGGEMLNYTISVFSNFSRF